MWRALVVVSALCSAAAAQPVPDRTERLVGMAKLWAKTKFLHPYLAYKDIDWDAALVRAIPKVEAAATIDQYRAALADMLAPLGDRVTRLAAPAAVGSQPATRPAISRPSP